MTWKRWYGACWPEDTSIRSGPEGATHRHPVSSTVASNTYWFASMTSRAPAARSGS